MARYATALQTWDDDDAVATTAWQGIGPSESAETATTTPMKAQEVAVFIRGTARLPRWFQVAQDSLNELSALPLNWNSYSARQIGVGAVTDAVELLSAVMEDDKPLPTFVPTVAGGVLLEWHTANADLEVTVRPTGRAHVVFERAGEDPLEVEGLPQEVVSRLRTFLQNV
jgi:hypothetical protein